MWGHDSDSKVLLINVFNIHFHTDRINEQIKQYFWLCKWEEEQRHSVSYHGIRCEFL